VVNSISAQRSNKEVGTTMGVWLLVPNVSDESDVIPYL